ncbi:hypothetical protein ABE057_02605 [Bacillus paralicheniformis]|uniref:hypothetical protein n=1 Tax=Bacillus paralicheniformis TaxID=1648923 RepID=UPI003D246954
MNGTTWTNVPNAAIIVGYNWGSGYLHETVLPEETNHQKLVYIRWLKTSDTSVGGDSSLGTTGSNRIDDIVVYGFPCKCEDVEDEVTDKVNEFDESYEHEAEEEPSESFIDEPTSDHEKDLIEKTPPETDEHASSDQEEVHQNLPAAPETEQNAPVPEDIQAGSDVEPDTSSPVPNDQTGVNEEAQTETDFGEHTTEADSNTHLPNKQQNGTKENQMQPDSDEHSKPSSADEEAADTGENQNQPRLEENSSLGNEQPTGIVEKQAQFNADKHLAGNGLKPPATDERMSHPEKTQDEDQTRNNLYSLLDTTVPDTSLSMDKKPAVHRETAPPASDETLRRKTNEILSKDNSTERHSGTSLSVTTQTVINDPSILKEKQAKEKQNNVPTKTDSPLDLESQKENTVTKRSKMKNEITFLNASFLFGVICLIGGSTLLFFLRRKKLRKNES